MQQTEKKQILGPEVGYIDLLDNAMIEAKAKEKAKGKLFNPLRPSAAGFCARKLAYDFNEYRGNAKYEDEEISPDLERLFSLGHSIEYNLIRSFEKAEIYSVKYKQQAMTFLQLPAGDIIEGSNDLCVYMPGHRCIVDVKSKGTKFSSYRDSTWDELDDKLGRMASVQRMNARVYYVDDLPAFLDELHDPFFEQNFIQLNLYATNEFMQARGIDHAAIIQYEKNKSRLREIRFRPSEKVKDYVLKKFLAVADAVDTHKNPELVEKEYVIGGISCAFCRHKNRCWPNASKRDFFADWPAKDWPKDTNRLGEVGELLEELYAPFAASTEAANDVGAHEEALCLELEAQQLRKVRFADGNVFELKFLKSPRPHFELRRSK